MERALKRVAGGALAIALLAPLQVARADWVDDAKYSCSDPLAMNGDPATKGWFTRPAPVRRIDRDVEHKYVDIDQKVLNAGTVTIGKVFAANQTDLDKDGAQLLKLFLSKRSRNYDFPFWSQQLPALSGYVLSATGGLTFGAMFSYFFSAMGASKANIDTLESFVAEGGQLIQLMSVDEANGRQVVTEIAQYRVTVGKELRNFALYSCAYPAKVVMKSVRTTNPPINPKLFEDAGGDWIMKNATTGAIEKHYTKVREDSAFYYFEENGNVPPGFSKDLRISRSGAPVQRMIDGAWQNLYSNTELP